jgi:hypothetical protein
MTTIVISGGQLKIGDTTYNSLQYTSIVDGINIIIFHKKNTKDIVFSGLFNEVTLNGNSFINSPQFVS